MKAKITISSLCLSLFLVVMTNAQDYSNTYSDTSTGYSKKAQEKHRLDSLRNASKDAEKVKQDAKEVSKETKKAVEAEKKAQDARKKADEQNKKAAESKEKSNY